VSAHIQAYLRAGASRDREVERIGPFTATFTVHSTNPSRQGGTAERGGGLTERSEVQLVSCGTSRSEVAA
jgi:hypothetical protein